jgi:hypothetical protein
VGTAVPLLGTGLGLAAGAGLNAYAVLLVYGAVSRFFPEAFPGPIAQFLASTPALLVAGVLFLLEFFADKIPGLDHLWHVLHSVVRPLVGALLAKSATRLTSTALTAGMANAVLSLAEDILAFLQSLVAIFLPMVALAVVAALGILFLATVPRIARSVNLFGRRRTVGPRGGSG